VLFAVITTCCSAALPSSSDITLYCHSIQLCTELYYTHSFKPSLHRYYATQGSSQTKHYTPHTSYTPHYTPNPQHSCPHCTTLYTTLHYIAVHCHHAYIPYCGTMQCTLSSVHPIPPHHTPPHPTPSHVVPN
jgi:hypothetical protein